MESYLAALGRAVRDAMDSDDSVTVLGAQFGGHLDHAESEAFGEVYSRHPDRLLLTVPIAEFGLAGVAVGMALAGLRPLLSFNIASFMLHGLPPVVNEAANIHYTTGGLSTAPATFYSLNGIRGGGASQHSHRLQSLLASFPGLQVFTPSIPVDAYSLLKWSLLTSANPTVFLAHSKLLLSEENFGAQAESAPPPGTARVTREGGDVTLVAHSVTVRSAMSAADVLSRTYDISAEVVDLRTIAPLDRAAVLRSAEKTKRVVIADESSQSFGVGAELSASIAESETSGPIAVRRVATADTPIPYNLELEREVSVTSERLVSAAVDLVSGG